MNPTNDLIAAQGVTRVALPRTTNSAYTRELSTDVFYVAATYYFSAATKAVSRLRNSEPLTLPSWFASII
jgi:hypothetical protein